MEGCTNLEENPTTSSRRKRETHENVRILERAIEGDRVIFSVGKWRAVHEEKQFIVPIKLLL